MSEVVTTLAGLKRSYRNKIVFSSSEPASQSKLRCRISLPDHETDWVVMMRKPGKNLGTRIAFVIMNPMIIFKLWNLSRQVSLSRSLYRDMPTIVPLLVTCKLTAPLHAIMDCYFPLLEMEHLP